MQKTHPLDGFTTNGLSSTEWSPCHSVGGVASVHGAVPVEARVPYRDVVRVEVGDVAVGVREDRVVGRVGVESP